MAAQRKIVLNSPLDKDLTLPLGRNDGASRYFNGFIVSNRSSGAIRIKGGSVQLN